MRNIRLNSFKNRLFTTGITISGLLVLSMLPTKVMAACPTYDVYAYPPSEVTLNPSVGIGGVMGTFNVPWGYFSGGCAGIFTSMRGVGVGTPNGNLYPTPFSGISYRIRRDGYGMFPFSESIFKVIDGLNDFYVSIDLVKTRDTISSGKWGGYGTLFAQIFAYNAFATLTYNLRFDQSINLKIPTCTISSSSISVGLTEAETRQLSKRGDKANEKSFSIPVNCPVSRNLSLEFSGDMADRSNGVFKNLNTGSGNKSTLGIQILRDGYPVIPGTKYNIGNVNGYYNVSMSARYYALADNVAAGPVRSVAYATIIYN